MKKEVLTDYYILKAYLKSLIQRPLFLLKYVPNWITYLFIIAFLGVAGSFKNPIWLIFLGAGFSLSVIVNSLFMCFFADAQYKKDLNIEDV